MHTGNLVISKTRNLNGTYDFDILKCLPRYDPLPSRRQVDDSWDCKGDEDSRRDNRQEYLLELDCEVKVASTALDPRAERIVDRAF